VTTQHGFNLQWLFWRDDDAPHANAREPDPKVLDAIARWGFNFVRLPCDYRFFTAAPHYPAPAEEALARVDAALAAARERGLHLSLNLHRAPGYVITGWESEPHNLWADAPAQDAFVALWTTFARRYAGIDGDTLSFDLVNEPPALGQRGFTRDAHEAVIRRTVAAIRAVDPGRPITIDGLDGGNVAMPELADLGVTHSGRGYQPMRVSHYRAPWWPGHVGLPEPAYPCEYDGRWWDFQGLRDFYTPWREVAARGVPVHIGEFGCFAATPDDVAVRWFADLLAVFREFRWGWALWEFEGPFGVVGHGRQGARFEPLDGFDVDRRLLDLLTP
jgi:endoglucanase